MAETATAEVVVTDRHSLKLTRCDRCGAEAKKHVRHATNGLELLLCNHHWDEHDVKLQAAGFELVET